LLSTEIFYFESVDPAALGKVSEYENHFNAESTLVFSFHADEYFTYGEKS